MAAIIVVVPACLTLFVTRTHTHTHTVARRKVANSQAPAKLLEKSARDAANTSKQFIRHRRTASTELCRLTYEWKQQLPVRHIAGDHESDAKVPHPQKYECQLPDRRNYLGARFEITVG